MVNGKKIIALCTSRIYDPQIHEFVETLNEKLRSVDCHMLIFTINSDIYWEKNYLSSETYVFSIMPYETLDCIVIMDEKIKSHEVSNRIINKAAGYNIPVIIVDGHYEGTTQINFDYEAGFEKVVRHIIEDHKVKKPHMLAGIPGNIFSDKRIDIFKKVLAENDIPYNDSMLSYGEFWADPAKAAINKLLDTGDIPDAIISANDIMAVNACNVLIKRGYRVPEDILVSGFDGYDEIFFTEPKITTSNCDVGLLAEATGETVIKIISGQDYEDKLIEPQFIANESCGCPTCIGKPHKLLSRFNDSFYRHQDDIRILHNVTSAMQMSPTPIEMAKNIESNKTQDLLCVVDKECFNREIDYFQTDNDPGNDPPKPVAHRKALRLIFDSDHVDTIEDYFLSPNYDTEIINLLDDGYPIIFNTIDYMNKPFGFICYHFKDYVITDYSRAASITNAISMGIGNFINLQFQQALMEQMEEMYKRDALTGLYNRNGFNRAFAEFMSSDEVIGRSVTLLMSDLDGLKYINDHFGHAEGDHVISLVATALVDACPDNAFCARFGGDEVFAVIPGEVDSDRVIKRINSILDNYNNSSGKDYSVATSCGAYTTTLSRSFNVLDALKIADEKMYEIKDAKNIAR